jgi:hypothetical protein
VVVVDIRLVVPCPLARYMIVWASGGGLLCLQHGGEGIRRWGGEGLPVCRLLSVSQPFQNRFCSPECPICVDVDVRAATPADKNVSPVLRCRRYRLPAAGVNFGRHLFLL